MASVPGSAACPLTPESTWRRLSRKLNTDWHKPALQLFTVIILAHWGEHLAQIFQVYVLGWPVQRAFGMVGMLFPWLVHSEALHYAYALGMLIGIWVLRKGFTGRSHVWWMIAFWIQFWHHIEHALLQYQVIAGHNFLGAPAPISLIQMLGIIEGPARTGFNGLLSGPPSHEISALLMLVRRVEVHMIYNTIVFIPMAIGMFFHVLPSPEEEKHMGCGCAWHREAALSPAAGNT